MIALILFALELLVQSCVVDDFKYSFFFWLDFIATASLVPDIAWIGDYVLGLVDLEQSIYKQDVKPGDPSQESSTS